MSGPGPASGPAAFGPDGLERRRVERIPMTPPAPSVAVLGARLVNVSRYGMMIESPVPLERDSVLQLRLIVAGEKADVEARVAACTPGATGGGRRFGIGLEFTMIPSGIRERLARALSEAPTASPDHRSPSA